MKVRFKEFFGKLFKDKKTTTRTCIIAGAVLLFIILMIITGVSSSKKGKENQSEKAAETYDVRIQLECEENLVFSKYNMNVYVDEEKIGELGHGTTNSYTVNLENGTHQLLLSEESNSSNKNFVNFEVNGSCEYKYHVRCEKNSISLDLRYSSLEPNKPQENGDDSQPEESPEEVAETTSYTAEEKSLMAEYESVLDARKKAENVEGMALDKAVALFDKAGYKHKFLSVIEDLENRDLTGIIDDDNNYNLWQVVSVENVDDETGVITVVVDSLENIEEKNAKKKKYDDLMNKFDSSYAWAAMKEYGKFSYRNFKLHDITGQILEEAYDENTWHLKATANVNGQNCYCEAYISGPAGNPSVDSFSCYDAAGYEVY